MDSARARPSPASLPGHTNRSGSRRTHTGLAMGQRAEYTQPVEWLAQRGQRTGDGLQGGVRLVHAEARHAAQQAHGVGVTRVREDVARRPFLDDASGVQHADALAQPGHQAQVVRDEQDGGVDAPAQLLDEVEDLGLHRGVQTRGGLVQHEQVRVRGEGHGDDHALLLTARELEGVAAHG